jgi:O-antigen ligase
VVDATAGRIGARSAFLKPSNLNLLGVALVAATASWFLLPAAVGREEPWPALGMLLACAGAVLVAWAVGTWVSPLLPPAIVAIAAAAALLRLDEPSGALGYENAGGLYFVIATIAALTVWGSRPSLVIEMTALAVAGVFGLATLVSGSAAAGVLLVFVGGLALAKRLDMARTATLVCGAVFVAALATTTILGLTYSGGNDNAAGSALSERRLVLWHDALEITSRHPLTGAGWDRFEELSPTALADNDAQWAHNEFLQIGAELGVPGLLLIVLLFVWGFARLTAEVPSTRTALAAAALAAVGIHASIDYVLHFIVIPLSVSVLLGAALAPDKGSESS